MKIFSQDLINKWDNIWSKTKYGDYNVRLNKSKIKIENIIESGFEFKKGMNILDIGCGDCNALAYLVKRFNINAFGIDISKEALKKAEVIIKKNKVNINIKNSDARLIPYPDNHFDLILSWGVIEHFDNYEIALKEFHRVLKLGGVLNLIQPHKFSIGHIKKLFLKIREEWPFGLQINFSRSFLIKILSKNGFGNFCYFIKPYDSKKGFINNFDTILNKINKNLGYYLYILADKN